MDVRLSRFIDVIDCELATLPTFDPFDRLQRGFYDEALKQIGVALAKNQGANILVTAGGVTVSLAGVRAASTKGLVGALRNWQVAARSRVAAGAGVA